MKTKFLPESTGLNLFEIRWMAEKTSLLVRDVRQATSSTFTYEGW